MIYNCLCSTGNVPSFIAELIQAYNDSTNSNQMIAFNNAVANDIYGYPSDIYWNIVNDYNYLLVLLLTIQKDIMLNGNKGYDYYNTKYKLDCIKKHFICYKYDATDIINKFIPKIEIATVKESLIVPDISNEEYSWEEEEPGV